MSRSGAVALVEAITAQGVTHVFGYPGGAIMPTYDAIVDAGFEHILTRHEQGAAFAAIGYARSTNKVGVCIATSGPGVTNLITGLADAYMDSIPVVAITGQVASHLLGTDGFQEIDALGLSLACCKHSFLVEDAETIPDIVRQAFELASSGRPGPVLIDIPRDVQLMKCSTPITIAQEPAKMEQQAANLNAAVELFNNSKKPILYVGGGAVLADAAAEVNQLLEKFKIPAVQTLKGLGTVNPDYPYYLGMLGMHGTQQANISVQECDLLIVAGARFDDRVTGNLASFAPHAQIIHIDIDAAEINKLRKANVALRGDLKQALEYITNHAQINDYTPWIERITTLIHEFKLDYTLKPDRTIQPAKLLNYLSNHIPKDAIVTTDVGQHQMWAAQHMKHYHGTQFMTSSGAGTMGFGLPVAVGAKIKNPDRQVICITGDGSIVMNIQELITASRYKAPVKIVLINNCQLGMVRQWQELFFNKRYSETLLDCNPDFIQLSKACYGDGEIITKNEEIADAVTRMLESPVTYILEVRVPATNVWPLVAPNTPNTNMLDSNKYPNKAS